MPHITLFTPNWARITGSSNSNSLKTKFFILLNILDEIDGHNDWQYKVASAFMIAHDYGFKRVMSSYYFQNTDQVKQTQLQIW
jgi:hypothetical protein